MKQVHFIIISILLPCLICGQSRLVLNNGGYLVMNGGTAGTPIYLIIENNNVTAGNGDGIKRITSGHIISENEYNKIQWNVGTAVGTFTFPIGKSTTDYVPVVFDKTSTGTQAGTGMIRLSSWYTANNSVWPSGTSLCGTTEGNVADRFWLLDVLNYSDNPMASVDFYYSTGEIQTIAESDLRLQHWNSSCCGSYSCKWETPATGTANITDNYVSVSGISDFSPWVMVRQSSPLPIVLLYFDARWKDHQFRTATLEWETTTEINSEYFAIQRSLDGVNFETIGTKPAAGNSSTLLHYDFTDEHETSGLNEKGIIYYRLKQVDHDGSFTFSDVKALDIPSATDLIAIFPNPSRDYIDYSVFSSVETAAYVRVMDAAGKIVISEKQQVEKGTNKFRLPASHLSNGNYILRINAGADLNKKKQFVITR